MQKWIYVTILCGFVTIASCTPINPELAATHTSTISADVPGYLSSSLVINRNGKTYNVVLGYDVTGEAFQNTTPQPDLNIDELRSSIRDIRDVRLTRYGDFDADGEIEYLVVANERRQSMFGILLLLAVDYDSSKDEYRIFDEIRSSAVNLARIEDIEQDGNPEIIGKDEEFHRAIGGSEDESMFAPIKIYRYNGQEFVSVTREYPDLVEKDANINLQPMDNEQQVLFPSWYASYLADMYLLGKQNEGIDVFNELCANHLQPYMLEQNPETTWSCEQFLVTVQDALSKSGYDQ